MKQALSPRELARAIGVSESSLKRWVDDGVIQASRTAGGHRRIAMPEAIRFIRSSESPLAHPEVLGLPDLGAFDGPMPARDDQREQMLELLRHGHGAQVRALAMMMYLGGQSIAEICDGPISHSMHRLGELWKNDERGIYIEHRAMDICTSVMNQLRMLLEVPADAAVATGGAPSGDPYMLPSLMAAATLEDLGFQAINLGPETPADALIRAAIDTKATLVWLSVSAVPNQQETERTLRELTESLGEAGISLIVGGRARSGINLPKAAHLHVGNTMAELSAFARGLRMSVRDEHNADQPLRSN